MIRALIPLSLLTVALLGLGFACDPSAGKGTDYSQGCDDGYGVGYGNGLGDGESCAAYDDDPGTYSGDTGDAGYSSGYVDCYPDGYADGYSAGGGDSGC